MLNLGEFLVIVGIVNYLINAAAYETCFYINLKKKAFWMMLHQNGPFGYS